MRRTGIAFADGQTDVPVALETIVHSSEKKLLQEVLRIAREKRTTTVVCGLPLLPSGDEGEQCSYVRSFGERMREEGLCVHYFDERHTTPHSGEIDGDAAAACQVLLTFLERQKSRESDIDK